jgi:hypothetical protein
VGWCSASRHPTLSRSDAEVCSRREPTIVVSILEVLEDHTTRPHLRHIGAENGLDLIEGTRERVVAAIFREEDRDVEA